VDRRPDYSYTQVCNQMCVDAGRSAAKSVADGANAMARAGAPPQGQGLQSLSAGNQILMVVALVATLAAVSTGMSMEMVKQRASGPNVPTILDKGDLMDSSNNGTGGKGSRYIGNDPSNGVKETTEHPGPAMVAVMVTELATRLTEVEAPVGTERASGTTRSRFRQSHLSWTMWFRRQLSRSLRPLSF
jgi:hypothetical protein